MQRPTESEAEGDEFATRPPPAVDPFATRLPGPHPGSTDDAGPASPAGPPGSLPGRFHRLRTHAKGGLGEVFLAHDRELRRNVALKEIQERHADHPDNRARFLLEAEITGGLEHPGIVPVYGLGHYPDGRPFYAMRFIEGDSLKEAIDRFHAADVTGRDPGERALALRGLLGRFLDVCNAIAFAHSKGVLHRDLKPGNVMLGPYGETLVVDWGLAKVKGEPDLNLDPGGLPAATGHPDDRDGAPSSRSGSAKTLPGAAMGTPQFMSPEQARGDLKRLGPASDVYSLGATLYALLTGRSAFEDRDLLVVIDKVIRGDFPGPRQVNRRVAAELDAACRKAMATDPDGRYPSARALAEDVEHWLADEPVAAFPDSPRMRARRWLRRHRILAQVIFGSLALLAAVSVVAALVVGRERDEARDARKVAEAEGERARLAESEAKRQAEAATKAEGAVALEKEKALGKLYATSVALAHQEWLTGNVARAEELLDTCPDRLRGWEWRHLKGLCHADLGTFRDHGAVPNLVGFSADGARVFSADVGGVFKVWEASTGRMLRSTPTNNLAVGLDRPGGRGLAASGIDADLMLIFDPTAQAPPRPLKGPGLRSFVAALRPDGRRMALGFEGSKVRLWDVDAGSEAGRLVGRDEAVQSLAYGPDGRLLAIGRVDGWVEVWELEPIRKRLEFRAHPGSEMPVRRLSFSPDGRSLATAALDGTVRAWDSVDGRMRLSLQGHRGFVNALAYSPDGGRIATGGSDRTVRIWDTSTGRELADFRGHTGEVSAVAFSADGARLLSASHDTTLKLWDAGAGSTAAPTSPGDGPGGGTPADRTLVGHGGAVASLAFRPDGRRLATVGWDGRLIVHDLAGGRAILAVGDLGVRANPSGKAVDPSLGAVAYSPDGGRIAVGGGGLVSEGRGIVRVLDAESGRESFAIDDLKGPVSTLAYSPDGRSILVATGGTRGSARGNPTIAIRDAKDGKLISEFHGQSTGVLDGAFSPDGKRVATTALGTTVRIWDPATGREQLLLGRRGDTNEVFRGVAWSPDGKTLAAAGMDFGVRLFDASTGRDLGKLRGHSGEVYRVAFSPDGRRLASAGRDATVKVWDVASGDELLTFRDHSAEVYDLAFSPDGSTLASASFDATTRLRHATDPGSRDTEGWDVLLVDRFDRAEVGDRWLTLSGRWTIEGGAARAELGKTTEAGRALPYRWAALSPRDLILPSTVEVRYDVRTDSTICMEAKFHETQTSTPLNGLCTLIAGRPTPFHKGDPATSIIVAASGIYQDILSNARHTLEKGVVKRVRVLREPRRLTVWIDGAEVVSAPVPEMEVPFLHLKPGFGEEGAVAYLDNVEIRAPRESAAERAALGLVFDLFRREPLKADVLAKLRSDPSLDPAARDLALGFAGRHVQGPDELNRLSYPVAVKPGRGAEEYRVALIRIEEANRQAPNTFQLLDSLGVALFRVGRVREALEALESSDQLVRRQANISLPTTLAFEAMARASLGQRAEALALLDRVGELATGPIWPQLPDAEAVRDEAERAIGSRASTDRERVVRDLTALGRAIRDDFEARKALVPPAITSADGRPLLSWRVALLPSLGLKELHGQFRLDEPWDGPHNRPLLARMPAAFGPAGQAGSTRYRVFVGPTTAFPASGAVDFAAIKDGTVGTLLVVEAAEAVPWTKPDEIPYAPDRPLPRLGSDETGRASLMLANGVVLTIRRDPAAEPLLRAMITRDGGEPVDLDRLPR